MCSQTIRNRLAEWAADAGNGRQCKSLFSALPTAQSIAILCQQSPGCWVMGAHCILALLSMHTKWMTCQESCPDTCDTCLQAELTPVAGSKRIICVLTRGCERQPHQACPVCQVDSALHVEFGHKHQQTGRPHAIHHCCLNVRLAAVKQDRLSTGGELQ